MTPLTHALAGEAALVAGALAVLGFDLTRARHWSNGARWRAATALGLAAILIALTLVLRVGAAGPAAGGSFLLDGLGSASRVGILVLAGLALLLAGGTARLRHPAEFVAILVRHMHKADVAEVELAPTDVHVTQVSCRLTLVLDPV